MEPHQEPVQPQPAGKNGHPTLKLLVRIVGFFIALASVGLAVIDALRAVRPTVLTGTTGIIGFLSSLYPVVPALICGIVGFIIGFGSKILSGSARRSGLTTASILLSILGILLSGASFVTTHIFPEGMIHETISSSGAPLNDTEELTQRINWAFGGCDSGWNAIDPERFPGVSYINTCASTSALFVAYDSPKQAKKYDDVITSKAAEYVESTLGHSVDDGLYSSLSGDQWLVVGPKAGIKKLHSLWGGHIAAVTSEQK